MPIRDNILHHVGAPCADLQCPCDTATALRASRNTKYDARGDPIRMDLKALAGSTAYAPVSGIGNYSSEAFDRYTGATISSVTTSENRHANTAMDTTEEKPWYEPADGVASSSSASSSEEESDTDSLENVSEGSERNKEFAPKDRWAPQTKRQKGLKAVSLAPTPQASEEEESSVVKTANVSSE